MVKTIASGVKPQTLKATQASVEKERQITIQGPDAGVVQTLDEATLRRGRQITPLVQQPQVLGGAHPFFVTAVEVALVPARVALPIGGSRVIGQAVHVRMRVVGVEEQEEGRALHQVEHLQGLLGLGLGGLRNPPIEIEATGEPKPTGEPDAGVHHCQGRVALLLEKLW